MPSHSSTHTATPLQRRPLVLFFLLLIHASLSFSVQPHRSKLSPLSASTTLPSPTTTTHSPFLFWKKQQQESPIRKQQYDSRKDEWARKYTDVHALRQTFGSNQNWWGDLDPATTRRLYKTLLPRALLELHHMGVQPEDLAPLAYRARVAAKLYARERCALPARVAANLYDGFRQWRKYGSFDTQGMSYQQVWEKYANLILQECRGEQDMSPEDVTARICLRILERSCSTNEMVDRMVLSRHSKAEQEDLREITEKLEKDVRHLLQGSATRSTEKQLSAQKVKTLKQIVRIKRRLDRRGDALPSRQRPERQRRQ